MNNNILPVWRPGTVAYEIISRNMKYFLVSKLDLNWRALLVAFDVAGDDEVVQKRNKHIVRSQFMREAGNRLPVKVNKSELGTSYEISCFAITHEELAELLEEAYLKGAKDERSRQLPPIAS